ncbi:hypothetical protein FOA52_010635 [Chlamydomonas sp. UWO 241]|nr:hypothetical protein FOA52_010635 [Chlamydomonas sp. UWO 241]
MEAIRTAQQCVSTSNRRTAGGPAPAPPRILGGPTRLTSPTLPSAVSQQPRGPPQQRQQPSGGAPLSMQVRQRASSDQRSGSSYQAPPSSQPHAAARPASSSSGSSSSRGSARVKIDPSHWDLQLSHYKIPLLSHLSKPVIVGSGLAFLGVSLMMEGPSVRVLAQAGVPVLMWWWVLLVALPAAFKDFAVSYMSTHPEVVPSHGHADEAQAAVVALPEEVVPHEKE